MRVPGMIWLTYEYPLSFQLRRLNGPRTVNPLGAVALMPGRVSDFRIPCLARSRAASGNGKQDNRRSPVPESVPVISWNSGSFAEEIDRRNRRDYASTRIRIASM